MSENKQYKVFKDKELWHKCLTYGATAFLVIAASITFYFLIDQPSAVLGFIKEIVSILTPIIAGMIIAFLLNPFMLFYEKLFRKIFKNKTKVEVAVKYLSITASLISGLLIIAVIFAIIIPNLISSITQLTADLPRKAQSLFVWLGDKIPSDILKTAETRVLNYINTLLSDDLLKSFDFAAGILTSGVVGAYNVFITLVVGIIVSFYILASKNYFKRISQKILCVLFKKNTVLEIVEVSKESHRIFTNFIVGKIIDSLIVGILCFIIMSITRLPYALLISFIVGVTNIIPFFGPFIGAIPSTFLILLDTPIKALYFVIFIIILQQFDGNILGPRILKDSLGISSFWVVFSIMLFGGLFGIIGMIIGAPLFAIIYNIIGRYINKRLAIKGYPADDENYVDVSKSFKE